MPASSDSSELLIHAAKKLSKKLAPLTFSEPVSYVYNPLEYAAKPHAEYLRRFASTPKKVVLLGMNPGPFGMTQTGVPFGEIASVRDWMGINEPVGKPEMEHPKRPVVGFNCPQSEVSGRRLWGLFAQRFGTADAFFKDHFVANYCPLVFMSSTGANLTPDKLATSEMPPVHEACLTHLCTIVEVLKPQWLIGVGGFAEGRALLLQDQFPDLKIARVLHPSPASPAANRDWAGAATRTLEGLGVW